MHLLAPLQIWSDTPAYELQGPLWQLSLYTTLMKLLLHSGKYQQGLKYKQFYVHCEHCKEFQCRNVTLQEKKRALTL